MMNIEHKNGLFVVTCDGVQIYEAWSHQDALDFAFYFLLMTGKKVVSTVAEA